MCSDAGCLAPIALFVYKRPEHTRSTVESLLKNPESSQSDLYIFSDAAKIEADRIAVEQVRHYIRQIRGFASVSIVEQDENKGLADSIIDGVTEVCGRFGRVIVLEDDLVTSPSFLRFMNEALIKYQHEKRVWHVSGWNYPVSTEGLGDAFLWRVMNCWGWATWQDRWIAFERNPKALINDLSASSIRDFNLDGSYNFWKQVLLNNKGKLHTWAIFWYATIFQNKGLCLNPSSSYVTNIGHDGSGENCKKRNHYSQSLVHDGHYMSVFPEDICESELAVDRIKRFLNQQSRKDLLYRLVREIKTYIYG